MQLVNSEPKNIESLKIYKVRETNKIKIFHNQKEKDGKYFCDVCGTEVGEGYALRSYEIHNKRVLCMGCHLKAGTTGMLKDHYIERA